MKDQMQETLEHFDSLVRIDWARLAESLREEEEAKKNPPRLVVEEEPIVENHKAGVKFSWWYLDAMESFIKDPTKIPEGIDNIGVEDTTMLRAVSAGMERLAFTVEWKSGGILTPDQKDWLKSLLEVCGRARYFDYSDDAVRLFKRYGGGAERATAAMFTAGLNYKDIIQSLAELEVNQFRIENFWEFSVNMLTWSSGDLQKSTEDMMGWALALCYAQRAYGEEWPVTDGLQRNIFLNAMHMLDTAVADVDCVEDWKEAIDEAIESYSVSDETMKRARALLIWSVLGRGEGASIWESILLGMALAQYPEMRHLWLGEAAANLSAWDSAKDDEGRFAGLWIHTCPAMCSALQQNVSGQRAAHVEEGRLGRYLENLEEQIREVRGLFLLRDIAPEKTVSKAPAIEDQSTNTEHPPLISYLTSQNVFLDMDPKWYSYVLRESFSFSEIQKFETLMAAAKKEGV